MRTIIRQYGFTLVEVLIAITIMTIMVTLAAASFTDLIEKKRIKMAAETVIADFNYFKQEGLKRRAVDFRFNVSDGTSWCYGIETGTCDCTTADDCSVREVSSTEFKGVSSITSSTTNFTYNWTRGLVTSGNITLNSPNGYNLRVVISALGRTQVCTPTDNVSWYPSC